MADYNNRFSRKPFNKSGGDRFGAPKQMHRAECSSCHAPCEVPFRPNGKKPVFCSNCFVKDADEAPRGEYRSAPKREFSPRPSYDRPAPARDDRSLEDVKAELRGVNEKLERLIKIMQGSSVSAAVNEVLKPAKKAVTKKKK